MPARRLLAEFGADLTPNPARKRIFCRPCLDWSERRYHVAGHVGAEICRRCLELGWLTRERDTRALRLTAAGLAGLRATFGVDLGTVHHPQSPRANLAADAAVPSEAMRAIARNNRL